VHPQAEHEVNFLRKFLLGGGSWSCSFSLFIEVDNKKVINFLRKKCTRREDPGNACVWTSVPCTTVSSHRQVLVDHWILSTSPCAKRYSGERRPAPRDKN